MRKDKTYELMEAIRIGQTRSLNGLINELLQTNSLPELERVDGYIKQVYEDLKLRQIDHIYYNHSNNSNGSKQVKENKSC